MPEQKQTLLFSATFPEQVKELTRSLLNNPLEIQVQSADASTVVQRVFTVNKGEKTAALAHLINQHQWRQALIFVNAETIVRIWPISCLSVVLMRMCFMVIRAGRAQPCTGSIQKWRYRCFNCYRYCSQRP